MCACIILKRAEILKTFVFESLRNLDLITYEISKNCQRIPTGSGNSRRIEKIMHISFISPIIIYHWNIFFSFWNLMGFLLFIAGSFIFNCDHTYLWLNWRYLLRSKVWCFLFIICIIQGVSFLIGFWNRSESKSGWNFWWSWKLFWKGLYTWFYNLGLIF